MVRKMSGRLRTSILLLSALGALVQLQGCGGGTAASPTSLQVGITKSSSASVTTTAAAAVRTATAASQAVPSPTTYSSIVLSIKAIQLVPVGSDPQTPEESAELPVIPLANAPVSVDISTLNYLQQVLGQAIIPPGKYNQVRLVLSDNPSGQPPVNYVTVNGSTFPLDTPSGQQSGVKILGQFEVKAGEINAIVLSFDPATAIVTTGNGNYILKPTGIRIDQVASLLSNFGSIAGTIHTPNPNPTFSSWSSATVSVVPRDPAAPAIAAGTVF